MSLPTFFISHGGGPWPWMDNQKTAYARLAEALAAMPASIDAPVQAILMISAHWEAPEFTVMTAERPGMVYDYHGFPPETYTVRYPAPGSPRLADEVQALLSHAGLHVARDSERGFDHGMFCPMVVAWPDADVPVVQLSLQQDLDPAEHLAMGRALAPLREQGILIIGSGLSYHNLRNFGPQASGISAEFDGWMHEALSLPGAARRQALIDWEQAPSARAAHPREEHLLPLMVATGAAGDDRAERVYHQSDFLGGISVSNFRFG